MFARTNHFIALLRQSRWGAAIGGLWTLWGIFVFCRDEFMRPETAAQWRFPAMMPTLSPALWMSIFVLLLCGAIFEGSFRAHRKLHDEISEIKDGLAPKLAISGQYNVVTSQGVRTIGLVVINNGPPQDNCLAKLTHLSTFDSSEQFYNLPVGLRTQHSPTGGPFNMRRKEQKNIFIASLNERASNAPIVFHTERADNQLPRGRYYLDIALYGASDPTMARFELSISASGELKLNALSTP